MGCGFLLGVTPIRKHSDCRWGLRAGLWAPTVFLWMCQQLLLTSEARRRIWFCHMGEDLAGRCRPQGLPLPELRLFPPGGTPGPLQAPASPCTASPCTASMILVDPGKSTAWFKATSRTCETALTSCGRKGWGAQGPPEAGRVPEPGRDQGC